MGDIHELATLICQLIKLTNADRFIGMSQLTRNYHRVILLDCAISMSKSMASRLSISKRQCEAPGKNSVSKKTKFGAVWNFWIFRRWIPGGAIIAVKAGTKVGMVESSGIPRRVNGYVTRNNFRQ
jgi:hypothetical protein